MIARIAHNLPLYLGRPIGKVEGSHIDDLVAFRKFINLCHGARHCARKFAARRHRYFREQEFDVIAVCDGCRTSTRCVAFVPEEMVSTTSEVHGAWKPGWARGGT